jgi:hypothetical protein
MASGDDTALLELFARHALAGGTNQFTGLMRLLFACALVGAGSGSGRPCRLRGCGPRRTAMEHRRLVIAAGVALITVPGPRDSGRESRPGKLSGDDLQGA